MGRGSMFDEKKDFILGRLKDGASIHQIYDELGCEWYSYNSLYYYVRYSLKIKPEKKLFCKSCENLVMMDAPYKKKNGKVPVCPVKKRVFSRSFSNCPYQCDGFMKRSEDS